jgi:hypothetical protein
MRLVISGSRNNCFSSHETCWLVVSLLLLGYFWGLQIFKITLPQLPSLSLEVFLSFIAALTGAILPIVQILRYSLVDKKRLQIMMNQLAADRERTILVLNNALKIDSNDAKMALVRVAIELEDSLRSAAMSHGLTDKEARFASVPKISQYLLSVKAIDANTVKSIDYIWRLRNRVVHTSGDVSSRDARAALDLAAAALTKLTTQTNL